MRKKFKVAVIGAGNMACEHLKVFNNIKQVRLVGIYSRTKKKLKNYLVNIDL